MGLLRRLRRDTQGAVAIMVVLSFGAVLACGALAIDLGSVYLRVRQLQGVADLAAMAAANNITDAQNAAAATAASNSWDAPIQAAAVIGTYTSNASVPAASRFAPGGGGGNAVQVTLTTKANLYFAALVVGLNQITISRTATAAVAQAASFSIGSTLLALQGGVANAVLSGLTGSQISLSAMSYTALASANVDVLQYSQALQTNANLQSASFNSVLSASISQTQALQVLGNVLTASGSTAAGQAVQALALAASPAASAQLSRLIDLGPYGQQDRIAAGGASIPVNALDLASAMLQLSQGGRQVQLSMGAGVAGLANTTVYLAIGQRASQSPWLTVNDDGSTTISTAQTRVYIDAQVLPGVVGGSALVNIPVYVEAASAEAKLSSLDCPYGGSESADLLVEPSLGQLALAQIDTQQLSNFQSPTTLSPAVLLNTGLLQATGYARTNIGGGWQTVPFSQADIDASAVKTVATTNITQATAASLLGGAQVQVQALGFGVFAPPTLTSSLATVLNGAAPPLDGLINSLSALLGVQLGQAAVQINGVRCNDAALVA